MRFLYLTVALLLLLKLCTSVSSPTVANSSKSSSFISDPDEIGLAVNSSAQCMALFDENRVAFDGCREQPCFLIKNEKPYVFISSQNSRHPFRCADRFGAVDRPHGSFFDLVYHLPGMRNALCVYVGRECTFNNQIEFLRHSHAQGEGHKFIVGGFMWFLSYRVTNYSIPSAPFGTGRTLVVGPVASASLSFSDAVSAIFGPFEKTTWLIIVFFTVFCVIVRVFNCFVFTSLRSWRKLWWNVLGEYEIAAAVHRDLEAERARPRQLPAIVLDGVRRHYRDPELEAVHAEDADPFEQDDVHDNDVEGVLPNDEETLQFWNKYWSYAMKFFFFIAVIFYELALFNHVFELMSRPPNISIQEMSEDRLRHFAVKTGGANEYAFLLSVDPDGKYDSFRDPSASESDSDRPMQKKNVPWEQYSTIDALYRRLLDGGMYSVSYESAALDQMRRHKICDKLTFYKTDTRTKKYHGGWYYSVDVDQELRTRIDNALTTFVERGDIANILKDSEPDDDGTDGGSIRSCGRAQPRINVLVFVLPLAPFSMSVVLIILVRSVVELVRQRTVRRRSRRSRRP